MYFHDGEYSAVEQKRTILPKFSNTTLGIIIRGRMRERERGKEFKGERETIGDWRERRERQMVWSNDQKAQEGWAPRLPQPAAPSPWC